MPPLSGSYGSYGPITTAVMDLFGCSMKAPKVPDERGTLGGVMMTVAETAAFLQVSETTVRTLVKKGEIPAYRPSVRVIRIYRKAFSRFTP